MDISYWLKQLADCEIIKEFILVAYAIVDGIQNT